MRPNMSMCHRISCALAFAAAGCSSAWAQADAARACLPIQDASARLACYDRALSRPAEPGKAASPASMPAAGQGSAANPAPTPAAAEAAFGLPAARRAEMEASSIRSRIVGPFDGWQATTRWTLANGQVWGIADGSSTGYPARDGPAVRLQRGAFGGFFIEIEGVSQSPRVQRLQ